MRMGSSVFPGRARRVAEARLVRGEGEIKGGEGREREIS